jgi:uncharacterized membrane protein YphA (DoxX/SURF4 family)
MKKYLPLLILRLALAMVFWYFGYQALTHPETEVAYISPALAAISPLPLETVILILGLVQIAAALAFFAGVWLSAAGLGSAVLLAGIISSIGLTNEIGLRDFVILASCLIVANSEHLLALQPTIKKTKAAFLAIYFIALIFTYVWLLAR